MGWEMQESLTTAHNSRFSAAIRWQTRFVCRQFGVLPIDKAIAVIRELLIMDRAAVDTSIRSLIEPFNKKGVEISDATTFANDLEFDSLTVMDFVAEIEDEFDIIISMNQQAEIENFGQLVDAVAKTQAD